MENQFNKFEQRPPSHQNAVDIFKGHWASSLSGIVAGVEASNALHFHHPSPFIEFAAKHLGRHGRLDGMKVLELGPLEGGRTYGLERYGADVLAIEANTEAYLKCLIAKEIAGLKARFMCGNFIPYLEETDERFDMVFAMGMLYHMQDPISVIRSFARVADKVFVLSAVYEADRPAPIPLTRRTDNRYPGMELWLNDYKDSPTIGTFWGGVAPNATWMHKADMLAVFRDAGFVRIEDWPQAAWESGGSACFCAMK